MTMDIDLSKLPQPVLGEHAEWVELWDLAWRVASRNIRESRGRRHMDAAWDPERNYQWVWDTSFMTFYCRYAADQFPGIESLDNFYELQRDDGYISMTYDLDSGEEPWPDRINPPLFAWAEWEYYRSTGNASRFARAMPHIERLVSWIDENRRSQAAPPPPETAVDASAAESARLYYFNDCGSSGMDDSPRTPRCAEAGQFFEWIDLSSQMALTFRKLSDMHAVFGNGSESRHWDARWQALRDRINRDMWCERTRFYHDRSVRDRFVSCKTAAGFWPILAQVCPDDRLDSLVEHLRDPAEFARPTPVPSLSADDPNYCPDGTYWVGGVWAPTNYMITRGLMQAGRGDVAHEIALAYLAGLARTHAAVEPHTLWECNSPEYDAPGLQAYTRKRVKPDFVGWSGLGPTAMLIENILGLDIDVPAGRVEWDIRLTEEHGLRQAPVGREARADLVCAARDGADAPAQVCVRSDSDLTVCLRAGDRVAEEVVTAGQEREMAV